MAQTDLAARVGVRGAQTERYESGATRVPAGRLYDIAVALGVPIDTLYPRPDGCVSGR